MPYNDFTEMPIWQLANEVVKDVYLATSKLPKREDYALCAQLRDAAISITGNIAEGFGRGYRKDKINFYYYARGSAYEVKSHLLSGSTAGYFSKEEITPINNKLEQVIYSINSIIKVLSTPTANKPNSPSQSQS